MQAFVLFLSLEKFFVSISAIFFSVYVYERLSRTNEVMTDVTSLLLSRNTEFSVSFSAPKLSLQTTISVRFLDLNFLQLDDLCDHDAGIFVVRWQTIQQCDQHYVWFRIYFLVFELVHCIQELFKVFTDVVTFLHAV